MEVLMPRALKSDKFFLVNKRRRGNPKGSRLLGINDVYSGGDTVTLKDLNDFLQKTQVDPAKVMVPDSFMTTVIP